MGIWNNLFFEPLYNALIFLINILPDAGLAIVSLTIVVKLILFPIQTKSIKSQIELKKIEPEVQKIKEEYKDKEEQAKKTFELYKNKKINPFSGCLLLLIQLPIIIALYQVFLQDFSADHSYLYNFLSFPENINYTFLGFLDIREKSIVLAVLTGLSQFFQTRLMMGRTASSSPSGSGFGQDLAKTMNMQMKYFLPVFIAFVASRLPSAVALYWTTSNLFGVLHEWYLKKKSEKE
ncbi:YidC/Oxa1 family membrane protein insertase [Candidatus Nomurabacteria bacterium]|nr:YidC/Oxa1 family membrane protein insertase [Candidatus Nomurabacteria bacterium]USN94669.1 MAG: YidC/Oxa1 family membrane protein insertase [Candidatus Nomurabacteria bacterium]